MKKNDEKTEKNEDNKKSRKLWDATLIIIISLARIGHGIFMSLSGPTLLYLADNTHATVGQISSMFTGRSAGTFVGTVVFGIVNNRVKSYQPLRIVAAGVVLAGVLMLITPWMTNLPGLVVITTITGLFFGYFDAGLQSLYLQLWGEKKSRPYIQSYHFMYGVGAFLAPVIASPFLQMADEQTDAEDSCPSTTNNAPETTSMNSIAEVTTMLPAYTGLNPVAWTYIMSGAFTIVIGMVMLVCAFLRIEDRVRTSHEKGSKEEREEEPIRDVIWIIIPVVVFYFMLSSMETVYQSYIYSIALCSELSFSVADASTLNTLFWVGFTVGRGSGIFYANFFKPSTIIIVDMIATTTALIILSIFGRYISLVVWIATVFHGLAVATFYAAGISWTSKITNVSLTYIFIFGIGDTIGAMSMLPLGGALFEMDPFYVVYQILGFAICNDLAFAWLTLAGRRHKKTLDKRQFGLESDFALATNDQSVKTRL